MIQIVNVIGPVIVVGVAAVLPLTLGGPWRRWAVAAASTAVALSLPPGLPAALFALPWPAVVVAGFDGRLATLYAGVAAGAFVQSRLGVVAFDVGEPFVALTAVHFTYAGTGALALAERARDALGARVARLGPAAVRLTASAPPFVALGFLTGHALPQVGGAVLMTAGVLLTAVLHLRLAASGGAARARRVLLAVSGVAPWAPMVLAVAWAAGQHWDVPSLSVPDMARVHGMANALGFTICGLVAQAPPPTRLAAAVRARPTYDHVGSTLADDGRADRFELDIGRGAAAFAAAVDALRTWVPQRRIGATVQPPHVQPVPGATILLLLGVGPFRLVVPNRVVGVVDEADRFAFAYGTLPGHPEQGEESFEVVRLPDDTVRLTIRLHARPVALLRPLAPLVSVVQRAAVRRYLRAVADHVHRAPERSLS